MQCATFLSANSKVVSLTYDLYDLSEKHSIRNIRLEVLDQALVSRLGKVVVGPVCVDLRADTHKRHRCSNAQL